MGRKLGKCLFCDGCLALTLSKGSDMWGKLLGANEVILYQPSIDQVAYGQSSAA